MPTGTALRLTASVGGNRAAGPPGFMGMTDHSDLGTHLIGSRRHAREETSSGRSPANKARSAVRRHESLHLIAHRNPVYLPGEMDGQTVHSGLREHAGRVMHASHAVHRQVRCTVAGG